MKRPTVVSTFWSLWVRRRARRCRPWYNQSITTPIQYVLCTHYFLCSHGKTGLPTLPPTVCSVSAQRSALSAKHTPSTISLYLLDGSVGSKQGQQTSGRHTDRSEAFSSDVSEPLVVLRSVYRLCALIVLLRAGEDKRVPSGQPHHQLLRTTPLGQEAS